MREMSSFAMGEKTRMERLVELAVCLTETIDQIEEFEKNGDDMVILARYVSLQLNFFRMLRDFIVDELVKEQTVRHDAVREHGDRLD